MATATDPTSTWTVRSTPFYTNSDSTEAAFYGAGYWVVGGNRTTYICTARNPTGTWTQRTTPFTASCPAVRCAEYNSGDNLWVAAGYNGELATAVPGV